MDRFVVGTGRCGSTLLSRMLARHDDVLSISEFFNGLDPAMGFGLQLSGDALAQLVSAHQPFVTAVLRRGYRMPEVTYPFQRPGARYTTDDPLPWILVSTLPSLLAEAVETALDPDRLYDEVTAWLRARPAGTPADQYRALFAWLGGRLGRSQWVERSGGAIDFVGQLVTAFPDARIVHLHRDGPEVALSMREHPAFRLAVALRYDVALPDGRRPSEIGAHDLLCAPTDDDPVTRVLRSRPDVSVYGRFWHDQIQRGLDGLQRVPVTSVRHVRFEDLVARPGDVLREIAAFFDLRGGRWIDTATELVRGVPPRRFPDLPPAQAEALAAVCRPAGERLAGGLTRETDRR